jgi:nitroreductase
MKKDDGSLSLRGEVTPLMQLFLKRRSVRKYEGGTATEAQLEHVLSCARGFAARMRFGAPRLRLVARDGGFDTLVSAAMAGVVGKTNPWLAFTRAGHLLLVGAVYPEGRSGRPVERAIEEAAMTMHVAVLAATDAGLATCWMAGINLERIDRDFPLEDGARAIAMTPLGLAPERRGLSWDALSYHLVSKRRKPLAAIRMSESWEGRR